MGLKGLNRLTVIRDKLFLHQSNGSFQENHPLDSASYCYYLSCIAWMVGRRVDV